MFSNTIVLTVNSVAKTLVKINQDSYASEYLLRDTLDSYRLKIRHTVSKRGSVSVDRHNVELVHIVYATTTAAEINRKVYLVFEQDTADVMVNEIAALAVWLQASTNAALISLANWES
jgi:hypothetical protein